ncbi:MAG: GNAT family N-acetyltransferase [archaeon]
MKFRKAEHKDIKQIQKMVSEGFEIPQDVANSIYPAEKLAEWFKLGLSSVLVDDDKIVAAIVAHTDDENDIVAWITLIVVNPAYHRKGIGTKVMNYMEDLLKSKGFVQMILFTEALNTESIKFYEKFGFAKVGEVDFLPHLYRIYYKKVLNQKGIDKFRREFSKLV